MRRSTIRRSWTSRGGGGRRDSYGRFRNSRTWIRCSGTGRKRSGRKSYRRLSLKRNELLPEHQRMQRRSQKMQSLQEKKRHLLKEACVCDEEMRKVREEISERKARYLELAEKSSNGRLAAEDLTEELRGLQAGEERKRHSPMDASSDACETADPSPAGRNHQKIRDPNRSSTHARRRRVRRRVRLSGWFCFLSYSVPGCKR